MRTVVPPAQARQAIRTGRDDLCFMVETRPETQGTSHAEPFPATSNQTGREISGARRDQTHYTLTNASEASLTLR